MIKDEKLVSKENDFSPNPFEKIGS